MKTVSAVGVCVLSWLLVSGARGEDLGAARACIQVADRSMRLACYDAAFDSGEVPSAAAASAAAPSTTPSQPRKPAPASTPAVPLPEPPLAAPEARFGDDGHLQSQVQAKAHAANDVPRKITVKVLNASSFGRGLYRLSLDNDQIWETREADWALDFKASDTVTISRLLTGSYQISLAGQGRSVGVKRIQ